MRVFLKAVAGNDTACGRKFEHKVDNTEKINVGIVNSKINYNSSRYNNNH